jgi:hypothetical protein
LAACPLACAHVSVRALVRACVCVRGWMCGMLTSARARTCARVSACICACVRGRPHARFRPANRTGGREKERCAWEGGGGVNIGLGAGRRRAGGGGGSICRRRRRCASTPTWPRPSPGSDAHGVGPCPATVSSQTAPSTLAALSRFCHAAITLPSRCRHIAVTLPSLCCHSAIGPSSVESYGALAFVSDNTNTPHVLTRGLLSFDKRQEEGQERRSSFCPRSRPRFRSARAITWSRPDSHVLSTDQRRASRHPVTLPSRYRHKPSRHHHATVVLPGMACRMPRPRLRRPHPVFGGPAPKVAGWCTSASIACVRARACA